MSKMKQTTNSNKDELMTKGARLAESVKRPYTSPKILSVEFLEAAAATCSPPAGGFGKHIPTPCGTLGS